MPFVSLTISEQAIIDLEALGIAVREHLLQFGSRQCERADYSSVGISRKPKE